MVVKGDDVRNTIRALENELKGLGDKAKKATDTSGITDSLKNAQTAIGGMKSQMANMAKAMGGDFDSILKAYERNSAKAISQFEAQYAKLEAERQSKERDYNWLQKELKSTQELAEKLRKFDRNTIPAEQKIQEIRERIKDLGYEQLKAQIEQNRQVRANLADIRRQAKLEQDEVQRTKAEAERIKERRKLQELEAAYEKAKEKRTGQKHDARTELKTLKDLLSDAKKSGNEAEVERLKQAIVDAKSQRDSQSEANDKKLADLKEKIKLQRASVELEAAQNRLADEQANAKRKEKYDKLEELKAKRKAARGMAEKALLKQEIALQKAYIKQVEAAEKAQKRNGDAIQSAISKTEKIAKAWEMTQKVIGTAANVTHKLVKAGAGITQFTYNVTGMAGGAARTAIGAGKAAFGMVSGAISGVSAVADREVEKERLANRVKGVSLDDAKDMMGQLYIQTGADYSVIVEAINRVQNVLKSNDKGELIAATATEIRYPGAAQTFASANTQADAANFARYGNRLKAVQNATGASDEQVQAASELINNLMPDAFRSASVTDLQTVYLGLQNSGAFDSQDELDKAFKKFISEQSNSGQNAFEFAQNYDWNKAITGERNRLQASNTLAKIDWGTMGSALNKPDEQTSQEQSSAETMAMEMRQMEEKKNELMLKLIPAVLPVVEKLADLITGPTGSKIIDGLVSLFETVIPMLEPVFDVLKKVMDFLNNYILNPLKDALIWISKKFGNENATPQESAGGLAFMPSIVGERGPEAIIPLDYSRAQRAENIANTVNQTFNMGNSQTTALSLAQAVRSRDFTRAMTDNQFFTRRCGAF